MATVVVVAVLATAIGSGVQRHAIAAERLGRVRPAAQSAPGASTCPSPRSGAQFYAPDVAGHPKTVALTFDDGPGPSTPAILKILETFGVRATFFNIGESEAARPGDVREEAADGFLVGNHTWSHPVLTGLSSSGQATELDEVIREQRQLVGSWPCAFRPPYGDYDATTLSLAEARHMAVWLWSVDTEDWKAEGSGSSYWVDRIISLAESEGGALLHPVVIMHNQSIPMPATVAALPTIIRYFRDHGYTFVDLLGRTGPPGSCGPSTTGFGAPPSTVLRSGRALASGSSMTSPGLQYRLVMQREGDLVLEALGSRPLWSSRTSGAGATLVMREDGDLAVISRAGDTLWHSRTAGSPGAWLEMRADGDLSVASKSGERWSSHTTQSTLTPGERLEPGWYLESPNMACRLLMQPGGSLSLFSGSRRLLWSRTRATHLARSRCSSAMAPSRSCPPEASRCSRSGPRGTLEPSSRSPGRPRSSCGAARGGSFGPRASRTVAKGRGEPSCAEVDISKGGQPSSRCWPAERCSSRCSRSPEERRRCHDGPRGPRSARPLGSTSGSTRRESGPRAG